MKQRDQLRDQSPAVTVDKAVDSLLVDRWLAGERDDQLRLPFYAAKWHWNLWNHDMPLASASRNGGCSKRPVVGK